MLKENSKVKVHFCDHRKFPSFEGEAITRQHDKIFEVKNQGGKLGIDYNAERSPYTCKGEIFTSFNTFARNVIFEDVETGKLYHYSNIEENIEEIK